MALNFPPNPGDKSIYIDPSSGLKYIFNGSVGAWETAIQPPVITTTDEKPLMQLEGFLWWDHPNRMLYVFKGGNWVPIMDPGGTGGLGVPVWVDKEPPPEAKEGWLWWHTIEGNLYVYYIDEGPGVDGAEGSRQWVNVNSAEGGGSMDAVSINSELPPPAPVDGQLWYSMGAQTLYIWDTPSQTWYPSARGVDLSADIEVKDPLYLSKVSGFHVLNIKRATVYDEGVSRFAEYGNNADDTKSNLYVSPSYLNKTLAAQRLLIDEMRAELNELKSQMSNSQQ